MGRPEKATYEKVAAICEQLLAADTPVTNKNIMAVLKEGSESSVQKHRTAWEAQRPRAAAREIDLPAPVRTALAAWVRSEVEQATAEATKQMGLADENANFLTGALDDKEKVIESLEAALATATEAKNLAEGATAQLKDEMGVLESKLAVALQAATDAQVGKAEDTVTIRLQKTQIDEAKARIAHLENELDGPDGARRRIADLGSQLTQAQTRYEAEKQRADERITELATVKTELQTITEREHKAATELAAAKGEVAAYKMRSDNLAAQLEEVKQNLTEARHAAAVAGAQATQANDRALEAAERERQARADLAAAVEARHTALRQEQDASAKLTAASERIAGLQSELAAAKQPQAISADVPGIAPNNPTQPAATSAQPNSMQ
ncbi:DNA-binding protein [Klebsiella pneumoniae]